MEPSCAPDAISDSEWQYASVVMSAPCAVWIVRMGSFVVRSESLYTRTVRSQEVVRMHLSTSQYSSCATSCPCGASGRISEPLRYECTATVPDWHARMSLRLETSRATRVISEEVMPWYVRSSAPVRASQMRTSRSAVVRKVMSAGLYSAATEFAALLLMRRSVKRCVLEPATSTSPQPGSSTIACGRRHESAASSVRKTARQRSLSSTAAERRMSHHRKTPVASTLTANSVPGTAATAKSGARCPGSRNSGRVERPEMSQP